MQNSSPRSSCLKISQLPTKASCHTYSSVKMNIFFAQIHTYFLNVDFSFEFCFKADLNESPSIFGIRNLSLFFGTCAVLFTYDVIHLLSYLLIHFHDNIFQHVSSTSGTFVLSYISWCFCLQILYIDGAAVAVPF